jgi:hypothetical protein
VFAKDFAKVRCGAKPGGLGDGGDGPFRLRSKLLASSRRQAVSYSTSDCPISRRMRRVNCVLAASVRKAAVGALGRLCAPVEKCGGWRSKTAPPTAALFDGRLQFYDLLGRCMPNWQSRRDRLNRFHPDG